MSHLDDSNTTAPVATTEAAHECAHRSSSGNGNGAAILDKKLDHGLATGLQPQRPPVSRLPNAKRKEDNMLDVLCGWVIEHQIGLAVNLLMLLSLTHMCFPRARRHTRKFFQLSYYNENSGEYCAGWNDAWMVFFWIVAFTGLRASVMDYVLVPFAKRGGIKTERDRTRFSEQAWLLVYYCVFWTLGVYIYANSDYWLNLKNLWTNWPNREMDGLTKWYTLVQYAFWLQQILVIHLEARRKDHWQMLTHHIITTGLIFCSYGYHQIKVANLILCVMDVVDLFLPLAKCLKYLGFTTICDVLFGLFMATWVAARHVAYLTICYSLWADLPTAINYGCYKGKKGSIIGPFAPPDRYGHLFEPFRDPEGVVCFNHEIKWGFLSALLFLQCLTLMWFAMILKVAVKVLSGGEADDVRSDDEDELDEIDELEEITYGSTEEIKEAELQFYEEEVGVEAINLKGRVSSHSRYKKGSSSATGVSLPGHSDRKELLGRIGCDKGT